jgi:hypothetical protein
MSERALEFVETWVEGKIVAMRSPAAGASPMALPPADSQAKLLAAQCLKAAQDEGIPAAEVNEAFDDLAAFIAGQIEEARDQVAEAVREDEHPLRLVDNDDARVIDDEEDEAEEDAKDD